MDPIDGTANFINGFPLYAASIGLLYRGYPLAGAIWCASTHALRSGGVSRTMVGPAAVRWRAIGRQTQRDHSPAPGREPAGGLTPHLPWDARQTGSAAIEGAFNAAGLLRLTRLNGPNLWDAAGAVALVLSSGGIVMALDQETWVPFSRFEAAADLGLWRGSLLMGEVEGRPALCGPGALNTGVPRHHSILRTVTATTRPTGSR